MVWISSRKPGGIGVELGIERKSYHRKLSLKKLELGLGAERAVRRSSAPKIEKSSSSPTRLPARPSLRRKTLEKTGT